jgi:hypothetical protein
VTRLRQLDGQRHYIGRHNSPESIQQYEQLVAEWLASGRAQRVQPNDLTIVELCIRFPCFLRGIFRWAAAEELIPIGVHLALRALEPLRRGRTTARETDPVRPVPPAHVRAIRLYVSRQVWAMIELQRLTGMRPVEVVQMRAVELDMTGRVWTFTPATHKTAHRGHSRTVYLGPRAQMILRPCLRPELAAPLFSPRDATAERARRSSATGSGRRSPRSTPRRTSARRARSWDGSGRIESTGAGPMLRVRTWMNRKRRRTKRTTPVTGEAVAIDRGAPTNDRQRLGASPRRRGASRRILAAAVGLLRFGREGIELDDLAARVEALERAPQRQQETKSPRWN